MQADVLHLYTEFKFWTGLIGSLSVIWVLGKKIATGFDWVKQIRTNDLVHIQAGVDSINTGLDSLNQELVKQTAALHDSSVSNNAIASELKELRQDFRTFYTPTCSPRKNRHSAR